MSVYRIEFSPEAVVHAEDINSWWMANREKAPALFAEEIAVVIERLQTAPMVGTQDKQAQSAIFVC